MSKMTKQAHDEAMTKIAAIDERDANNAVELGFLKAAQDMGLSQDQYNAFREIAIESQKSEQK